MLSKDDNIGIR